MEDVLRLINSSKDCCHPQFLTVLKQYYLYGGKKRLAVYVPRLISILPTVDLNQSMFNSDDQPASPTYKDLTNNKNQHFGVKYIYYKSILQIESLGPLLVFFCAFAPKQNCIPTFELFLETGHKLAGTLAIKCFNLPTTNKFVSSHRLNERKGGEKIKNFEVAHRLLLEMMDTLILLIDSTSKSQVQNKNDILQLERIHVNQMFQKEPITMDNNDYCESFVLLQILSILSKTGVGELYVTSMISIVLNASINELLRFTEGHDSLRAQSLAALYRVAKMTKLTNFESEVFQLVISLREPTDSLDRIIQSKMIMSTLAKHPPATVEKMIFEAFGKKLFYNFNHIDEAKSAFKKSWIRYAELCTNLADGRLLVDVLTSFDESSVFFSKHSCSPIGDRFFELSQENTFTRDILLQSESPVEDLINKVAHVFMDKHFYALGLYFKSSIVMMQGALRKSLSRLESCRPRP